MTLFIKQSHKKASYLTTVQIATMKTCLVSRFLYIKM